MMIRRPMHRLLLLASLALLVLAAACTSKRDQGDPGRQGAAPSEEQSVVAPKQGPVTRNYDSEGRLLPSEDYVAGVRLPRGAQLFREDELQHVYRIRAPIDKVLAYFGPMMVTGNVERRGKGAVYKRASVRGAEISPTKLDVSILEVGSSMTRISITELPPPPEHVPTSDQTKAAARDSFRMLD
ncbi:MAG: hypothetical protein WCE62_07385 [Polyangiales bacterium]